MNGCICIDGNSFVLAGDRMTKICGSSKIKCYNLAKRDLATSGTWAHFRDECNCLPSCNHFEYNLNINWMDMDQQIFYNSKKDEET